MTRNIRNNRINENVLVLNENTLYEINGETYSLNEIIGFIETSNELSRKVQRQSNFIRALKIDNSKITIERNKLCDEIHRITSMGMFEFATNYCDDGSLEESGRRFAQELLGGA